MKEIKDLGWTGACPPTWICWWAKHVHSCVCVCLFMNIYGHKMDHNQPRTNSRELSDLPPPALNNQYIRKACWMWPTRCVDFPFSSFRLKKVTVSCGFVFQFANYVLTLWIKKQFNLTTKPLRLTALGNGTSKNTHAHFTTQGNRAFDRFSVPSKTNHCPRPFSLPNSFHIYVSPFSYLYV